MAEDARCTICDMNCELSDLKCAKGIAAAADTTETPTVGVETLRPPVGVGCRMWRIPPEYRPLDSRN